MRIANRLMVILAAMVGFGTQANACGIANLPPTFQLGVGANWNESDEVVAAQWENFTKMEVNVYSDCGSNAPLVNAAGTLTVFIGNNNPHYKSFVEQLRFAKATMSNVTILLTVNPSRPYGMDITNVTAQ